MDNVHTTPEEVRTDNNFMCGLVTDHIRPLKCYLLYQGGIKMEYYLFVDDKLLFYGKDFKPAPIHNQDSLACLCTLLDFLTLKPGDTDPDFFKNYTPEQLDFAGSVDAETLRLYISDYQNGEGADKEDATKVLRGWFIN